MIFTVKTFLSFFSIHCLSYFPLLFRNLYSTHLFHTDKTYHGFLHICMWIDRHTHIQNQDHKKYFFTISVWRVDLKKDHKLYDIYIFYLSDYLTLYNRLSFIKHTLQLAQVHSSLCLVMFHCIYVPQLLYPFICAVGWWGGRLKREGI